MGQPDMTVEASNYCASVHAHKTSLYMLVDGTTIQNILFSTILTSWAQRSILQVFFSLLETIWPFVQSLYHNVSKE
jgi:hypothetical protein